MLKARNLVQRFGRVRHRVGLVLNNYRYPGRASNGITNQWATTDERSALAAAATSDFAKVFFAHDGRPVLKWSPYLDAYDRHFGRFRNTDVGLLEIGVFEGGSLELWRAFLGADARILGVDIDPACADRVDPPNEVLVGSQADPRFLISVAQHLGRIDIVIDDGSHMAEHQMISFETLFPLLEPGGIYVIEDTHTSYWHPFGGGRGRPGTALDLVRRLCDDIHAWHHDNETSTPGKQWVPAVHVYDSLIVIEKALRSRPVAITSGTRPA